jgi:CTP synthase
VQPKYIAITGGVLSGLGKGICTASIAKILQARGFKVIPIKIDGYLNYDAGTLRPTEHGEVWVTDDGGEIDQDLGHYERFLDIPISKENNITSGQIYWEVISNERKGKYLGKTVQLIPHVTDEIKRRIRNIAAKNEADFVLIEIGGTVGDYENSVFIEAVRQMRYDGDKIIYIHVSYLPIPGSLGEQKTKPTQISVRSLLSMGIQPDFIVCRSEKDVDDVRKEKIALFCNVDKDNVISDPDCDIVYELPLIFERQGLGDKILQKFGIKPREARLKDWENFISKVKALKDEVKIGIVGKYFDIGSFQLSDSYISVIEAIKHAAWFNGKMPKISWIDSKQFEDDERKLSMLRDIDGIIVPGGFGSTGVEGKMLAIKYARENNIPFLGLCFGLQLAVIEFARNVCGLKDANTTEVDQETKHPVIDFLPWQKELIKQEKYGSSMRLGAQEVLIKKNTLAYKLYGKDKVMERFRHRYEVNPSYIDLLERNGLVFSGMSAKDENIMQIMELPGHKFFLATQFHPEFLSRPLRPHPLFVGLIKACIE